MPTDQELREHIVRTILTQVSRDDARRKEALGEFFALTLPDLDPSKTERLAALIPPLLPALYTKWGNMFVDRLLETVDRPQLDELADGSAGNDAAITLTFVMFLESERMERQMAEDLQAYGHEHAADAEMDTAVAGYLQATLARLGSRLQKKMH
jgi:hypothetical protein